MSVLENLSPQNVFHYFEEISKIPRGSYNMEKISAYLADFAREHKLEYYQDADGNVVIIKEASAGYEDAEPVILQGHMDMVCEKEEGVEIDFANEGLRLYTDGDFLKAEGTTLGGDDGIAVAYALAILEDDALLHPRLEVVITTNEEVGLLGAKSIDLSMLKGHILFNIDSDVEGHFLTSCAGGLTAQVKIPVRYEEKSGVAASIRLHGLTGGQSGSEIDKEHANAIIEMGRILKYLDDQMMISIVSLEGGLKDNAIPRDAVCKALFSEEDKDTFCDCISKITEILKKEYAVPEPDLTVSVSLEEGRTCKALCAPSMQKALFYLRNAPNGVMHMSTNIKGLVETSLNAGIMKLTPDAFCISSSIRSSVGSRKEELSQRLTYLTEFLGGEIVTGGDYPAWEYCTDSKVREYVADVYEKMFGKKPVFEAIHAGLECGILSDKIKNLDAVSFGPDNFDIHTPKERLSISSAGRVYRFITELLRSMK